MLKHSCTPHRQNAGIALALNLRHRLLHLKRTSLQAPQRMPCRHRQHSWACSPGLPTPYGYHHIS